MTYPKRFPEATWVGSKLPGKLWEGTTEPVVVLHTVEGNYFPDPQKWDAPSHLVYNPNTKEIRQYISMDKAAYSVRDNALEDDFPTYQVELWGNAANVPNYSDIWYEGVAELIHTFVHVYDIPLVFADFTNVQYGKFAPQRMTDEEVRSFTGFLGHAHMGRGTDTHWDPGKLDVTRVLQFAGGLHESPPAEGDKMEYRGVLNVPNQDWARNVVDWGVESGVIKTGDNFVDDWDRDEMTDGRFWTFLKRFDDYLISKG